MLRQFIWEGNNQMNREKALAKNTLILSIGEFLPKFSSIITLPIITGGLTKAEMGTYDLISTLVSLFLPVATLQIQSAAFRFLIDVRKEKKETKRIITNIICFILPTSFIALVILYFLHRKSKPSNTLSNLSLFLFRHFNAFNAADCPWVI